MPDERAGSDGALMLRKRDGWTAWVGPEVEGRLLGIQTLCLGAGAPDAIFEMDWPHILFGTSYLQERGYGMAEALLGGETLVTLEVTPEMLPDIPPRLLAHAHLLCRSPVPHSLNLLKPSDTVRLDLGMYHVLTVTRYQMQETVPADYDVDVMLATKEQDDD